MDPAIARLDLLPHFTIIGGNDFKIPDEWREWLGSIRVQEVEACDLFIAAKLKSAAPDILDSENIQLSNLLWAFYRGLLLSSTFATAHKPVILTGSCRDGEIGLRQQQDLDAPVPNDFRPYPEVTSNEFRQAASIAERLERLAATRQGSNVGGSTVCCTSIARPGLSGTFCSAFINMLVALTASFSVIRESRPSNSRAEANCLSDPNTMT
jgi:hypothetical protein